MLPPLRSRLLCALGVITLLISSVVSADVVLKPNGQNSFPLRTKALKAEAIIDGQFAATRLNFTFQNETYDRIEADFIYTLPPDTVVTYFAYWFGEEKVVARIVEKERAAAIYQHITSRMRDPALVEMIGKDTFRARIFPVMPNADLRVEMVLMQILPSDRRSVTYAFPVRGKSETKYDSLDFRVSWKRAPGMERFTSNYGTKLTLDNQFARFRLKGTNYRPPKDLRVTAMRSPQPLYTELYAAPSGGSGGFFALALTPNRALTRPTVQISGVKTSEILPARLPDSKPGRALRLFGRYTGSGPATITLIGTENGEPIWYSERVIFGSKPVTNNIASKLWAWRKIEQLSANDANRNAVIALSKRFLLPSKFTSWLAVPKAEMERYKREKIAAEIEGTAQRLAREIVAGRERGTTARRLRNRLSQLCSWVSKDPKNVLQRRLGNEVYRLAERLAKQIADGSGNSAAARRLRARLNWLCKETGMDPQEALQYSIYEAMDGVAAQLAKQIRDGQENSRIARRLQTRLNWMGRLAKVNPKYPLRDQIRTEAANVAQQLVAQFDLGKEGSQTVQRLRKRLDACCRYTGQEPQDVLREYMDASISQAAHALGREILDGQGSSEKARSHRADLDALCERYNLDPLKELSHVLSIALEQKAANLMIAKRGSSIFLENRIGEDGNYEYAPVPNDPNGKPNPAEAVRLLPELERLAQAVGKTAQDYLRPTELMWAEYDIRQIRAKLLIERRKKSPDPATIRELETRFHALNQQIKGEQYARERASRISARNNREKVNALLKESQVYVVQAKQRYQTMMEARESTPPSRYGSMDYEGRYRMGDPLIQVEAPEDAEQVIAIMPDGEVKRLAFHPGSRKWEARFDIPGYAQEGAYVITLIIVRKDGTRQTLTMRYHVDVTPPEGTGRALAVTTPKPTLRLELDASDDTARVTALLPWGDALRMNRSTQTANRFFALVPQPSEYRGKVAAVTFVLTDKAHNRTTVLVNMEDNGDEK